MIMHILFILIAISFVFNSSILKGGDVLRFDPSLKKPSSTGGSGGSCNLVDLKGRKFFPSNQFIYQSLTKDNLTVIRGSETFHLTPSSMRSYFLKVLLDPQVGDLFSGSSYGGFFNIVESREGDMITLRHLESEKTNTYSIKQMISLSLYPILPNGLPIPYINSEVYFDGPRIFDFTDGKSWYTISYGKGKHEVEFNNRYNLVNEAFVGEFMSPETLGIFVHDTMSHTNVMVYSPFGKTNFGNPDPIQLVDLKKVSVNGSVSFYRAGKVISIDPPSLLGLRTEMTNPIAGDEFIFENQYVFIEMVLERGNYVLYKTINGGGGGGRPLESFNKGATPLLPGGYPISLEAPK